MTACLHKNILAIQILVDHGILNFIDADSDNPNLNEDMITILKEFKKITKKDLVTEMD